MSRRNTIRYIYVCSRSEFEEEQPQTTSLMMSAHVVFGTIIFMISLHNIIVYIYNNIIYNVVRRKQPIKIFCLNFRAGRK